MMKNKTKLLAALGLVSSLAVGGYAVTAYAHGSDHDRGGDSRHGSMHDGHGKKAKHMMRMLDRYDANNDGVLQLDEMSQGRANQFKKFDTNGDGMLTLDEYKALWLDAMHERMVDRFQKHDNDGDGKISEEDFSKRFMRMMTWMDRNEDGKLDRDDRRGYGGRHHDKDDDDNHHRQKRD